MVEHGVHDAARAVERQPAARALARGGYVANGLVHLLIGSLIIAVAFGGDQDADQTGAFRAVAEMPLGFVALWAAAALLAALGVWHLAEGMLASRRREGAAAWGLRISEWGQAFVFLFFGGLAAAVALGARPRADQAARDASRGVLALPGGVVAIVLVGLGVAVAGVVFAVMGVRRSFRSKMSIPDDALGRTVAGLGVAGFIAKGIALGSLGLVLVVAALRARAEDAGSLDAAIRALLDLTLGPAIVVIIGAGLIAYGVFTVFRARYARL
ncbi:DUF1206 domain-containing protein [Microbacterium imperiale]|uniref:DUF1206 domain-containing protein n=1 Tax=Microbacterium imperiale TaxID=33884 RepID=A0A9W6HIM3_9MICO|nr:DUF1206 domain-containing protein [Microbacterium imperiale]MBP2421935.1 hypothetical protein [Microbacterium imperiale]BFE39241.1 DUF1206 domain-containing protein [Microbacterium imperiale]GLJ81231.1 hypothetical protein GCM10017586_29140 [Microbacterium imperiale]